MAHAAGLDVQVDGTTETITLQTQSSSSKIFTLNNPDRLVIDVATLPKGTKLALPQSYNGVLIRDMRVGQFNPTTTRIVFDLNGFPASTRTESRSINGGTLIKVSLVAGALTAPVQKKAEEPKKETRPMIVIDAGHGGRDPGAISKKKTKEKDVVLRFARSLRDALQETGRYRVHLTRDSDTFILLRDRLKIAREAKADLFISIHADAAPGNKASGLSVYTLSETASDKEAELLAARENKVDVVYGLDLSDQSKDVADILISLAQRDTNNRSVTLASTVVSVMGKENITLLPNPHRFAGFAVLKAPDIPSILVELGFLTNPREEKLLNDSSYRKRVVKGLIKGIDAFFEAKEASSV